MKEVERDVNAGLSYDRFFRAAKHSDPHSPAGSDGRLQLPGRVHRRLSTAQAE